MQERVVESVLARLRVRMAGLKCLGLSSDEDRLLVDAAVQEAQQQGVLVGPSNQQNCPEQPETHQQCLLMFLLTYFLHLYFFFPQLIQSCTPPSSGAQYPPTVLSKAAPSSPFVVSPPPGPLLPLLTFRSSNEAVTLGEEAPLAIDS